jgi:hypoxanthine phosphoribosyltransferase
VLITKDLLLKDLATLRNKINKQYEHIVAIQRGGVPVGNYLAHHLGLPITYIKISSYDDRNQKSEITANLIPITDLLIGGVRDILIVDDLVDSGNTFRFIDRNVRIFDKATLYWKSNKPTYSVKECTDWLEFPWDLPNDGFDESYLKNFWA